MKIKLNQIYRSNKDLDYYVIIMGKGKCDKWQAKVLTNKTGVFAGSHSFADRTLQKNVYLM